ncbi:MAG: hypothetical protein ACK4IK_06135 [Bacteroidia bacterium]
MLHYKKYINIFSTILFFAANIKFIAANDSTNYQSLRVTTNPGYYIFNTYPITIEKIYKNKSIGLHFSFKPSTKKSGTIPSMGVGLTSSYLYTNFINDLNNAFTIGLNSKIYLIKNYNILFIEPVIFYRYWWFKNKYASFDNYMNYSFEGIRTEKQHVFGTKFLIGCSFNINRKHKYQPYLDIYWGLGARLKYIQFYTYEGFIDYEFHSYHKDQGFVLLPSLHFGLNLGLEIKKSK